MYKINTVTHDIPNYIFFYLFICTISYLMEPVLDLLVDNDAIPNPILYVGGNCSIQGFDHYGTDVSWTVKNFTANCIMC